MVKLHVPATILADSLAILKASPDAERVILWLGHQTAAFEVREIFMPLQITRRRQFTVTPDGMRELYEKIKASRLQVVAQLHTHPQQAFHSQADDDWAIVRHLNAYSIVLPDFCQDIDIGSFHQNAATFVLTIENEWVQVSNQNIVIQ